MIKERHEKIATYIRGLHKAYQDENNKKKPLNLTAEQVSRINDLASYVDGCVRENYINRKPNKILRKIIFYFHRIRHKIGKVKQYKLPIKLP